ncbi:uncharacterized protein LOC131209031 [Anopheles bellator]|uniref:uncharacterized protein LOC131209031 n=1 Tax=Anopheles bellator TaxID=139047 RepID=UPI0026494EFB|nr:uncharacterized protein LOC131209031 [Anopheles bellator]
MSDAKSSEYAILYIPTATVTGPSSTTIAPHPPSQMDDDNEYDYLIPNIRGLSSTTATATVTGLSSTTATVTGPSTATVTVTGLSSTTANSKLVFPIDNAVELCRLGAEQDERPVELFAALVGVIAVGFAKKGKNLKNLKGDKLLKKTINFFLTNEFLSTCVWASPNQKKPNAISYHVSALNALYKAHKHFDKTYEFSDFEKQMRRFVSKTRVK